MTGIDAGKRVFELRVYHTFPGRLAALHSNFRNHNVRFLKKHGITSIGYWTPQDPPASGNTLIFILAHESREAAERNWKAFRDDPEWQKLAKASEADGKIVKRVESTFMAPTEYSALK
jgi:NIPSNAP protein